MVGPLLVEEHKYLINNIIQLVFINMESIFYFYFQRYKVLINVSHLYMFSLKSELISHLITFSTAYI